MCRPSACDTKPFIRRIAEINARLDAQDTPGSLRNLTMLARQVNPAIGVSVEAGNLFIEEVTIKANGRSGIKTLFGPATVEAVKGELRRMAGSKKPTRLDR